MLHGSSGGDDDVDALARVAATDPDPAAAAAALAQLYDRYADTVFRICYQRLRNQAAAEDAAGATWLRVAQHIGAYQPRGAGFLAWLATLARNCALDQGRKMGRQDAREVLTSDMLVMSEPAAGESAEDVVLRSIRMDEFLATLRSLLAPREWDVIVLRFFHGLTPAETANALTIKEGAVRVAQTRAIAKLRAWWIPTPRVPGGRVAAELSDAC